MWVRGLKLMLVITELSEAVVAPRVGAWIETFYLYLLDIQEESHPVWVRGLKQRKYELWIETYLSHPVWVRGLKHL